ncbi:helix-turn-helix domain-containing protein [Vibrio sp. D431a]|uniref:helix-turn-helix domain-containing protein n=1 Tax=Vibrio sp. D431a TaxID=2837388 RepID=UPI002554BE14|nr:helix-turn-helix domain-containing protein [Vibrio sp. D431a]MDK9789937.1 hypothetical protein [Vibrio sp. D431a]
MSSPLIIDKKTLVNFLKTELEPTRLDMKAKPDMSWVLPMVKEEIFKEVLHHCNGNQTKAAKMLGVNRGNYSEHLKKYKVDSKDTPK